MCASYFNPKLGQVSDIPFGMSYRLEATELAQRMLRDSSVNDKSQSVVQAKMLTLVTPEELLFSNSSRHGSVHTVGSVLRGRKIIAQRTAKIPRVVDVLPKIDFGEQQKPGMILQFSWMPHLSVILSSEYRMQMYAKHIQLSPGDYFGMSLDATGEV